MKRIQQQNKALGSQALFTIVVEDNTDEASIFDKLWTFTNDFENRFSRFLIDSELTRFNASAGKKILVSAEFAELLEACNTMIQKTDSLFNPFILPALNKAGYVGSWPNPDVFAEDLNYEKRSNIISANLIMLDDKKAKIPSGTALDFGGIGKGFLLDKLGQYLQSEGIVNFWLSLGGDILCSGQDLNLLPWSVSIQHAIKTTEMIGDIKNDKNNILGIATSGITKRKGTRKKVEWHHIIDPRTGKPAVTDILTATISARTATEADVLAKCAIIVGSSKLEIFAKEYNVEEIYAQLSDGSVREYKYKVRSEL